MEYELQKLYYEITKLQEKEKNIISGFKEANLLDNKVAVKSTGKLEAYKEVLEILIPTITKARRDDENRLKYIESLRNEIKRLEGEQK